MLQVPVYYDDVSLAPVAASVPNLDSLSNYPEITEAPSYQSYHFGSSSPGSNAVEDPRATTATGYQSAQPRQHLKLTRPIEVKPNRDFLRADGVARGDVDFPSFDSEFRTLYGGSQGYHVGGPIIYSREVSMELSPLNFRSTK